MSTIRSGFGIRESGFGGRQSGISLVELIMFIVIVSVALAGLLLVLNIGVKGSADPLMRKQALAVAESLLEEIELQNFSNPAGGFTPAIPGSPTQAERASFDDITDYNGFATNGVYPMVGSQVPGLENYNVAVSVAGAALGGISAASAALITVTVTGPDGQTVDAVGYRAKY